MLKDGEKNYIHFFNKCNYFNIFIRICWLQQKNTKKILTEPISIEFVDGEAFRLGEYKIGIDTFMLYALDIAPMFINQFGEDCWAQESIDLGWRREAPQKAFILYATDIIASSVAVMHITSPKEILKIQ